MSSGSTQRPGAGIAPAKDDPSRRIPSQGPGAVQELVVDARRPTPDAPSPMTLMGGLALAYRPLRTAALAGALRVFVVAEERDRPAIERLVLRRPPQVPVEFVAEPPSGLPVLSAYALYPADGPAVAMAKGTPPMPELTLGMKSDIALGEKRLMARLRKSVQADGVVAYFLQRPIARAITRALLPTSITPNMVTILAGILGLAGAACVSRGGAWLPVFGALLLWFGAAVDCVDGELARLKLQFSKFGEWLDSIADDTSTYCFLVGLGVGLVRDGHDPAWIPFVVIGAVAGVLTTAKMFIDLHRAGLPIDTAQYPWFFGTAAGTTPPPPTGFAKLMGIVGYAFRRDAVVTILLVAIALDARPVATVLLFAGTVIMGSMLVVHLLVMQLRKPHPA